MKSTYFNECAPKSIFKIWCGLSGDYMYIHEHKGWPHFIWDQAQLAALLAAVRYLQQPLEIRTQLHGNRISRPAYIGIRHRH